jgi:glutamine amidotransferase
MTRKVGIVDYGMGNLRSVYNAVKVCGAEPELIAQPEALRGADCLILPGVGAFGDAMEKLRAGAWLPALDDFAGTGRPVLGICLGMQLMAQDSDEGGLREGLGWFPAKVRRFPEGTGLKVPHIGWNDLHYQAGHPLFRKLPPAPDVYFVHSYRLECEVPGQVLAWSDYGGPFTAVIGRDNLYGVQFHPEKSQQAGLALLRNFLEGPC